MEWVFFDDPAEFLEVAGDRLAQEPVLATVIAGVADRIVHERAAGIPWAAGVPCWFAAVLEGRDVVGTAMRTAPFGTYPPFLMPMPDVAANLLAATLHDRGESIASANGALPTVQVFCDETARLTGGQVEVAQHTRLFELTTLIAPAPVAGRLRPARQDEFDLVSSWYDAFAADADEQAGRAPGTSAHDRPDPEALRHKVEGGRMFLWEDAVGTPVNLTAVTPPSYGVSRIGPVYTPKDQRGNGYGSAAVAAATSYLLDRGERACLFTDQANPTSNKIYEAIGYERVVDMANLLVTPVHPPPP